MTSSNIVSAALDRKTKDGVRFGKELREKEFMFAKGYLNLNHGSFGTYPKTIRDKMRSFQDAAEARPDSFIRYEYPVLLDEARASMAKLLNAPLDTLVFVPNATTGINIVLRNLTYTPGEHILYFSPIYGACEKTVSYITETTPASAVKISFTYPVEDDSLIAQFHERVSEVEKKGGKVKVAIFDTVVSMPGVRMPFERLVEACRERGVLSCVDGAHGVGHVELDLGRLEPDFWVSNCHKWLHTPRGSAIFHVPLRNQHLIRSTLPTSHGFTPLSSTIGSPFPASTKHPFTQAFEFTGTIDAAPYLCVPAALEWRETLGGEEVVMRYCQTLAREGAKVVAKALGTEVLENKAGTLGGECCLSNVRLPISVTVAQQHAVAAGISEEDVGAKVRDWMAKVAVDEYGTFVQNLFHGGAWWVRLSGQVYLDMSDMEWAAGMLGEVCKRVGEGEWVGEGAGKGSKL